MIMGVPCLLCDARRALLVPNRNSLSTEIKCIFFFIMSSGFSFFYFADFRVWYTQICLRSSGPYYWKNVPRTYILQKIQIFKKENIKYNSKISQVFFSFSSIFFVYIFI